MASEEKPINVNLLVHEDQRRVVLAEADKDFVDILFSFLTLPLGTIIRLLNMNSMIGSVDQLYKSVEKIDVKYLQTEACRTMLLCPQNAAASSCKDLKLNIDDTNPKEVYVCQKPDCCSKSTCFYSPVPNARCPFCQEIMKTPKWWRNHILCGNVQAIGDGVFVKQEVKFMITDDLHVLPASMQHSLSLFHKTGIKDGTLLNVKILSLSKREVVLNLLRALLISKTPLTDTFLRDKIAMDIQEPVHSPLEKSEEKVVHCTTESDTDNKFEGLSLKLLLNKANNRVACAEAGEDMMDLLLSFLTMPLGSIIKFLDKKAAIGCVDNLYSSIEDLGLDYIKSEDYRNMLLSPKLAPFFTCSKNWLKMTEVLPIERSTCGCNTCFWTKGNTECTEKSCVHGVEQALFRQLNPKSTNCWTEVGGGYSKGKFLLSNKLQIFPISLVETIRLVSSPDLPFDNLVEREAKLGEIQVRNLLRAVLTSKTPFDCLVS